jgi:hypothetical protein
MARADSLDFAFEHVPSQATSHLPELPALPELPEQGGGGGSQATLPPEHFPQQAVDALSNLPEHSQANLPDWLLPTI